MNIVFFGTPQFAVPSLQRLLDHPDITVLAVVTQPDKPRGRGKHLIPSPVKQMALAHHLPIWQPNRIKKDAEALEKLQTTQADAFVVIAYGQILSQQILDMPRLGCVNAHGSLLPRYRGAAPIQWSLYHGDSETGITTMLMDAGMDTGPMLLTARTPIALLDNFSNLAARLADLSAELLIETLLRLDQNTVEAIPQDDAQATYAPLIKKEDYWLDWSNSAIALHNQIRGFHPNCVTTFRAEPIKILATVPLGCGDGVVLPAEFKALEIDRGIVQATSAKPGEIVAIAKGFGPLVQTGNGLLLLREVQPAGKRPQSGTDFTNGSRVCIGDAIGNGG
jgi:methionyl-tRNA formyltransferase